MRCRRLASLDASLGRTGWATFDMQTGRLTYSSVSFPIAPGEPGPGFDRFDRWSLKWISDFQPDLLAIETPHHRGWWPTLYGVTLCGIAIKNLTCAQAGGYITVPSRKIKAHATGNGNAKKPQMLGAAQAKWPAVENHDEADALWLLDLVRFWIRSGEI